MAEANKDQLEQLLDQVEAVFRETDDYFRFTVGSFQHVLTARDVHQQISGESFTIAEFYDFIGDKRAIETQTDYLTEHWRQVIRFLLPMLQEGQLSQLAEVIIDDPLVNSIAEVGEHRIGELPIIIHAHTYLCNPDAYFILANVYEHLANTYGLNLICMEGAVGPVDTSLLATFPDAEIKRETAEYLVRQGKLTAPELVSVTSEKVHFPVLIGLEDPNLFDKLTEFEKSGKRSGDFDGIYDMTQRRREYMLRSLGLAIEMCKPFVMAVESSSTGLYEIPDLVENTPHTIIRIRPKVPGGINWELYYKVLQGQKTAVEEILTKNVA